MHGRIEAPEEEKTETVMIESENESLNSAEVKDLDAAAKFLAKHGDVDTSHIDINKLRHKIDRNVVSIMCAVFIMQFLDKAIYNYTGVMGLKKDLHFRGNEFSHVASAYAIAHLVMQVPNAYIIQKLPAGKYLSVCVLGWGLVTLATTLVTNFAGMVITRVFLAICEATISPSLMLITAQWYTKSEQAPRFALWHCAPGIGQILGGLLSYAFQGIPHDGRFLNGWRMMFLVLGFITMLVGAVSYWWLPDTPMNAKFLKTEEKVALLKHVSVNMTGVANHKARPREVLEALKDPQIYLLVLPGIFAAMSAGLSGTYSTTLIHGMGYDSRHSALLNMPSGIVGITCNLIVGFGIRRTSNRWAWAVGLTFPGITGATLLAFTPQKHTGPQLLGLYMVVAIYSITTVVQQWAMANVSGHTKRAVMAAAMSACYGIGSIIAPQTFQDKDKKSGYLPAKLVVLATQATCTILFVCLRLYYGWENRRRDKRHKAEVLEDDTGVTLTTTESWAGLTDRQNKRFRYIY